MNIRFHAWHTFFSLLFAILVIWGGAWLHDTSRLSVWVPTFDFFLMALAVFRLTRLFVYDTITQFIRDWFAGSNSRTFSGTLGTLINCPWCVGLWFGFLVPFFYYATPYAWFVILVFALGAVGSFVQILANLIAWKTDAARRSGPAISVSTPSNPPASSSPNSCALPPLT